MLIFHIGFEYIDQCLNDLICTEWLSFGKAVSKALQCPTPGTALLCFYILSMNPILFSFLSTNILLPRSYWVCWNAFSLLQERGDGELSFVILVTLNPNSLCLGYIFHFSDVCLCRSKLIASYLLPAGVYIEWNFSSSVKFTMTSLLL